MKFRISLAANVTLTVALIVLGYKMLVLTSEQSYYRKVVGSIATWTVKELDDGKTQVVRQAFASLPSDPNIDALEDSTYIASGPHGLHTVELKK